MSAETYTSSKGRAWAFQKEREVEKWFLQEISLMMRHRDARVGYLISNYLISWKSTLTFLSVWQLKSIDLKISPPPLLLFDLSNMGWGYCQADSQEGKGKRMYCHLVLTFLSTPAPGAILWILTWDPFSYQQASSERRDSQLAPHCSITSHGHSFSLFRSTGYLFLRVVVMWAYVSQWAVESIVAHCVVVVR